MKTNGKQNKVTPNSAQFQIMKRKFMKNEGVKQYDNYDNDNNDAGLVFCIV